MAKEFQKTFSSRLEEFENTLLFNTNSSIHIEMPEEVKVWNQKASKIQSHFDFILSN